MANVEEAGLTVSGTDTTVTTTAETVAVSSGPVVIPKRQVTVLVIAWCAITVGAGGTSVTPRVRRGTTTSGTLVGEANLEQATAGNTVHVLKLASEERVDEATVEYSLTVAVAAATGNSTVVEAGIVVLVL